jgi:HK97 family phage major capsid protein
MANAILEEMQKLGETVTQFQQTNDERLEAIEKGNDGLARELDEKLTKMGKDWDLAQAKIKSLETDLEKERARVEIVEALLERPNKSPQEKAVEEYNQLFHSAIRKQFKDQSINQKLRDMEEKDVVIGTGSAGGFALPKQIGDTIDALLLKLSDVVANVRNIQVGTSDYQELVSVHGGNSAWVGETGTRNATDTPFLRNRKPTWGELYAYPKISEWALQDIQFNAADWIVNDVAEGMAQNLSAAVWNGDASDKPTGIINTAPVTTDDHASPLRNASAFEYIPLTHSSPIALTADDLIDLVYLLNPRYRSMAKFAMNTVTQGVVRKMKDSNGQYLWQPSLQAGQPDRLLGYEVFTWEDMANPTTGNGFPVAFGDFTKGYLLTRRVELRVDQEGITQPGYVKFYVRRRWGGIPLNNDALKLIKVAAT